jgi:hypothetical protein
MSCLLHARNAFRLPVLLCGLLVAQDRRCTVTSWPRITPVSWGFHFWGAGFCGLP